jgi:hypothetical protein
LNQPQMMMVTVEQLMEWRLAGETEVLAENLPQRQFVHHKSHMTRPGLEPRPPRWCVLTAGGWKSSPDTGRGIQVLCWTQYIADGVCLTFWSMKFSEYLWPLA